MSLNLTVTCDLTGAKAETELDPLLPLDPDMGELPHVPTGWYRITIERPLPSGVEQLSAAFGEARRSIEASMRQTMLPPDKQDDVTGLAVVSEIASAQFSARGQEISALPIREVARVTLLVAPVELAPAVAESLRVLGETLGIGDLARLGLEPLPPG